MLPYFLIADFKFEISFFSSELLNGLTSPVHIGRVYSGVPPLSANLCKKVGNIIKSAGAFLGLSPENPV